MSVDLESWVHRPIFRVPLESQTKLADANFTPAAVEVLLEKLSRFDVKATFFCLGTIADWYPDMIRQIVSQGHELAAHGYTHQPLHRHTRRSFESDLARTLDILARFSAAPTGFRAPSFTHAPFLYDALEEHGFNYDSSILPIKTPLYDWSMYGSPAPFWVTPRILEIPLSIHKVAGIRIPVGGLYLRLLGGAMNVEVVRRTERKIGVGVFYIHPWELVRPPEVGVPWPRRLLASYRIPALEAFENVLRSFSWTSFGDSLDTIGNGLAVPGRQSRE